jgi:tricarballylate dehydrogenase
MRTLDTADVIVVGAGNAATCAALAARESGAKVVMLEAAPRDLRGGNTAYAGGRMRAVYHGVDDLVKVIADLTEEEIRDIDWGQYTEADFLEDIGRVTQYRCNPDLVEYVVNNSHGTLVWLRSKGVKFQASFGRQSSKVDGKIKFFGGVPCEVWGGGAGLVDFLHTRAEKEGITVYYDTSGLDLLREGTRITGLQALHRGELVEIHSKAVVLACGGFEANAEMRSRYLGANWELAKVRGTRYNTGRGIRMALDIGARAYGHWSCAHASSWDLNAPEFGDPIVRGAYQKHSYPFGIMVNARGERFLDEGADFNNFTYARYGREILQQPGMFAWQVFDQRATSLLRETYRIKQITRARGDTLEDLVKNMEGVDAEGFLRTVHGYNKSVPEDDSPINPGVKDGYATTGLSVKKSNWSRRIDKGPFEAYAVTAGITFTFGGIKITTKAEAEDDGGNPIPGLFVAGEMVGGIFYHNYPSGTGLTCGATFGRQAGHSAGTYAMSGA